MRIIYIVYIYRIEIYAICQLWYIEILVWVTIKNQNDILNADAYFLSLTIHLWNINAQIYNYIHFAYEAMLAVKEYQRHFLFMYYVPFGIFYNLNVFHASWIIVFRNVIHRTKAYSFLCWFITAPHIVSKRSITTKWHFYHFPKDTTTLLLRLW